MGLSVDETSRIQSLDRPQPGLPMKKGRCGTRLYAYPRQGTTTWFAALNLLDGNVIGDCLPRHRHQECLRFLKKLDAETQSHLDLHLRVENDGTPQTSPGDELGAPAPAHPFALHPHHPVRG